MDRALQANVITKSGKAVETAGDIDTLRLDKTDVYKRQGGRCRRSPRRSATVC